MTEEFVIVNVNDKKEKNRSLSGALVNAFLMFLITYGVMGMFLNSYELPYSKYILVLSLLAISVIVSMFYLNTLIKVAGYIAIVGIFVICVRNLYWFLRGGFAYVINTLMEDVEDFLYLPIERRFATNNVDEKWGITLSMIFIGLVSILLLNIVITEFKSVLWTYVFTMPFIFIICYFEKDIPLFYMFLFMTGLIGTFIIKRGTHYQLQKKKNENFIIKNNRYSYGISNRFNLYSLFTAAIISLVCIIIISVALPKKAWKYDVVDSTLKQEGRENVKVFALVGLWGMLNKDGIAAAGMGEGKLGNVGNVAMDYQPDLKVFTVIDDINVPIYLKAFNGTYYEDNQWKKISDKGEKKQLETYVGKENISKVEDISGNILTYDYMYNQVMAKYLRKIRIVNVNASDRYNYIPYNLRGISSIEEKKIYDDAFSSRLKIGDYVNGQYLPVYQPDISTLKENVEKIHDNMSLDEGFKEVVKLEKAYRQYVYDTYLEVPSNLKPIFEDFYKKYNINKNSENVVLEVKKALFDNYEYSIMPGQTPKDKDFVTYFLTESKKGYCTYFTTTAVLMFRNLGIPARYCGGYALDYFDFFDGTRLEVDDIKEWSVEKTESKVKEITATDACAHAWAEIYIDGYGWYPVETTPPSEDDEDMLVSDSSRNDNVITERIARAVFNATSAKNVKNTFEILMISLVIALVVFFIGNIIYKFIWFGLLYKKDAKKAYSDMFNKMKKMYRNINSDINDGITFTDFTKELVRDSIISEKQAQIFAECANMACFSDEKVPFEKQKECIEIYKIIYKRVFMRLKWYLKIWIN